MDRVTTFFMENVPAATQAKMNAFETGAATVPRVNDS